jgi:hypothetical protein
MRYILFFAGLAYCFTAAAQVEGTVHFMNSLPQVVNNNPAFRPFYKGHIGLPGSSVLVSYTNNGFTVNDFLVQRNGSAVADLNRLSGALRDRNFITKSVQADLFRMGFQLSPRFYLMGHVTAKAHAQVMIPGDAVGLLADGTTPYVNGVANLSGSLDGLSYLESALGASIEPMKNLRIGVRAKFLQGALGVSTGHANASLAVNENNHITTRADVLASTSGFNLARQANTTTGEMLRNTGFGIDLGASVQLLPGLSVNASLIDLGFISWKNDVTQYRLDPARASHTFSGIDINRLLNDDETYLRGELDTLRRRFSFAEAAAPGFRTMLPARFMAGAQWELIKRFSVGGLIVLQQFGQRTDPSLTLSASKQVGRALSASASYTVSNRGWNNLGLGVSLNLAPFQLYVVGDNLLRVPVALVADGNMNRVINSAHLFNIRAGLNFVWGRIRESDTKKSRPVGNLRQADLRQRKKRR